MIAFGVSIPLFFVTAWAAVTSNWLVLAPVFVVICGGELWFLWRQMRDS